MFLTNQLDYNVLLKVCVGQARGQLSRLFNMATSSLICAICLEEKPLDILHRIASEDGQCVHRFSLECVISVSNCFSKPIVGDLFFFQGCKFKSL